MGGFENIYKHWMNWQMNVFKPANTDLPHEVKSVWIYRYTQIGDLLLMTPFPRLIKKRWPEAKITVVVSENNRIIWQNNPYVDRIFCCKNPKENCLELGKIAKIARLEGLDLLISTDHGRYSAFFCKWCKPKILLGFFNPQLPENFWSFCFSEERIHRTELLQRMALAIGLDITDWRQEIYWTISDEKTVDRLFVRGDGCSIGFSPWSRLPEKNWPFESIVELCILFKQKGYQMVLLGGKSEIELAQELEKRISGLFINLVGKTTLRELAIILKRIDLLISCDTGTAHMAATVDCPAIVTFGPSSALIWKPYSDKIKAVEGERCSGCDPSQFHLGLVGDNCFCSTFECSKINLVYICKLVEDFLKDHNK